MLVGYARVSTMDQSSALQMGALLDFLRQGDTLVVWKLSRLARSLTQVIKTAADIGERGIALKVLAQNIDTATPGGAALFPHDRRLRRVPARTH